MFRTKTILPLSLLATVGLLSAASPAAADRLVIPASAHAAGAFGSTWVTDLSVHNAGTLPVALTLRYVPEAGGSTSTATLSVPAKGTRRETDALPTLFGLASGSGAILVDVDSAAVGKVAIGSRTYNRGESGTFGQEVPAIPTGSALSAGDHAVLFLPSDVATSRLNGGVFATETSTASFRLLSEGGTVLAEKTDVPYAGETATRYNDLVRTLFGADAPAGAVVEVEVESGRILVWGSRIDNRTNDGDFAVARRVRSNELPQLVGLDTGGDGSADVFDEDGDLVLDESVALSSSALLPYELRLVASDPEGRPLTWSAVEVPQSASLDPATGILRIWASASLGAGGKVRIRISDGTDSIVATIPIGTY